VFGFFVRSYFLTIFKGILIANTFVIGICRSSLAKETCEISSNQGFLIVNQGSFCSKTFQLLKKKGFLGVRKGIFSAKTCIFFACEGFKIISTIIFVISVMI